MWVSPQAVQRPSSHSSVALNARLSWFNDHQPPPELHARARSPGGVAGILPRDGKSLGANVSGIPEPHAETRSLGGGAGLLPRDGQSLGVNVSGIPE